MVAGIVTASDPKNIQTPLVGTGGILQPDIPLVFLATPGACVPAENWNRRGVRFLCDI